METIDTIAWLRPDGRLVHTAPADLPQSGAGLWAYRPRDPRRAPVLIRIAPRPDGAIGIAIAEVDRNGHRPIARLVHQQVVGPALPPGQARTSDTPMPVDTAAALALAMAWADRPPTP